MKGKCWFELRYMIYDKTRPIGDRFFVDGQWYAAPPGYGQPWWAMIPLWMWKGCPGEVVSREKALRLYLFDKLGARNVFS